MVSKHNATASPSFFSRSLVPPPSALQPFPPLPESVSELRVLNAYAGIGGNRHLWPDEWIVRAIELDPRVAAEYASRYPQDTVIVGDAHAYVMEHGHEFDAVWTSPPCPTHSRLAINVAKRRGVENEPDPRLWAEVAHLRALGGLYVVENVHTYYAPPILPDVVTERHYYWTSAAPMMISPISVLPVSGRRTGLTADAIAESYGIPPLAPGSVADRRKAMRNAVVPAEGLAIASAAFAPAHVLRKLESGL
jgi:DNA (cytosine-5)-methyltransferase 1